MSKQGEIEYLSKLGPEGVAHARDKPFSDARCGALLADLGAIFMVLPPPPARLLDLGCGTGWTSILLARRGYDVFGIDIAPDMIAVAESNRERAGLSNVAFQTADYEAFDPGGTFDAAIFYDALHHAIDPKAAVACAWRALQPSGVLVTLEPGRGHSDGDGARAAVEAFGVTERDMAPSLVMALGREAGFRSATAYPMPKNIASLHYEDWHPRWWPRWWRPIGRWLATGWIGVVGLKRYDGLVVLQK